MKKAEIILGILALAAVVLKFLNVPFTDIFILITLTILSTQYFYLGFALLNGIRLRKTFKKSAFSHISKSKIVGSVIAGISLAYITIGILFKLLSLGGANIMLSVGLVASSIILIISMVYFLKQKDNFYRGLVIRFSIYVLLGFVLWLS